MISAPHSDGPGPADDGRHRDRQRGDHEDGGRDRVAPRLERARLVGVAPAQHEDGAHRERREEQHREARCTRQAGPSCSSGPAASSRRSARRWRPTACETAGGCGRRRGRTPRRGPSRSRRGARRSSSRSGCRGARRRPAPPATGRRLARAAGRRRPSRSRTGRAADVANRHGVEVEHVQAQVDQHDRRRCRWPSARGTFRPGSRISSATYAAAFHPLYENITTMKASGRLKDAAAGAAARCATLAAAAAEPQGHEERPARRPSAPRACSAPRARGRGRGCG